MPSLDLSKPVNEYGIVLRWACQTMTDKYFLKKHFIIWCLIIKTHLRAFNNYVDQILHNFDHLPPLEWTFYWVSTDHQPSSSCNRSYWMTPYQCKKMEGKSRENVLKHECSFINNFSTFWRDRQPATKSRVEFSNPNVYDPKLQSPWWK